jgi:hypothetical protein
MVRHPAAVQIVKSIILCDNNPLTSSMWPYSTYGQLYQISKIIQTLGEGLSIHEISSSEGIIFPMGAYPCYRDGLQGTR